MDISIEVGTIYAFSDHYLRVLYARDNQVMLEKWAEGGIQGYSVVTGPYMHEGKLAWLRSCIHKTSCDKIKSCADMRNERGCIRAT